MEEHNKILDRHIGLKIRERRKILGLTQAELAELMELSHQQIQRYESGENTISMARILVLSQCLSVKPDYFYEHAPLAGTGKPDKEAKAFSKDTSRQLNILLVEDTDSDALLFRKATERSMIKSNLHIIQNPEEVIDYLLLNKHSEHMPDLIILDINMPRLNGLELLRKIKGELPLRELPIIMLTNSIRSKDMLEAYSNFANGFVQKNSDLMEFYEDIDLILQYWSRAIVLPSAA